jgi:diguanylate cyclase (GGDEF)-like protein
LFGGILAQRFRSADRVACYGGEEFAVILADCSLVEAMRLADGVRQDLERRSITTPDGRSLSTTVSAGCAVIRAEPGDAQRTGAALVGAADLALFAAKCAGRNHVTAG